VIHRRGNSRLKRWEFLFFHTLYYEKGDPQMRTNYRVNSGVRFQMLSQDQLQELVEGVLHLLEYTGLDVHHEEARDVLKKAGARVDGLRVRLPP
jgi:trimethylamine--corrinoid protein Co-methyltransferase